MREGHVIPMLTTQFTRDGDFLLDDSSDIKPPAYSDVFPSVVLKPSTAPAAVYTTSAGEMTEGAATAACVSQSPADWDPCLPGSSKGSNFKPDEQPGSRNHVDIESQSNEPTPCVYSESQGIPYEIP